MATTKVGVYRSYYGPIPLDKSGQPLPSELWPEKRLHSWVVRWFGADGDRYSRSFGTRKEADRFAETKQNDVREGQGDPPEPIRFNNFIREHEQVMAGQVARETLLDQLRAARMFMKHTGEQVFLQDIKPRHAEAFVAARLRAGSKVATVNKDIRTLKRIFNLAVAPRGYLTVGQNPFAGIKQRRHSTKPVRYVTPQEFHKLLKVATDSWWKALFLTAYTSGARLGEILNLTWADLDFEQNRVRIACKDADAILSGWEPKDHEGRVLPVPAEVMQAVINLQAEAPEGCPYVFVPAWRWTHIQKARRSGRWKDEQSLVNNLVRRLNTLRRKAGVAKFSYHDLRRSCITNWARALPVHVVQKLAGHSDIKTTQRYYLSVQVDDLEKARLVQAALVSGTPTDQKLTNSAPNGPVSVPNAKGPNT